jgi:hypothetical protein
MKVEKLHSVTLIVTLNCIELPLKNPYLLATNFVSIPPHQMINYKKQTVFHSTFRCTIPSNVYVLG